MSLRLHSGSRRIDPGRGNKAEDIGLARTDARPASHPTCHGSIACAEGSAAGGRDMRHVWESMRWKAIRLAAWDCRLRWMEVEIDGGHSSGMCSGCPFSRTIHETLSTLYMAGGRAPMIPSTMCRGPGFSDNGARRRPGRVHEQAEFAEEYGSHVSLNWDVGAGCSCNVGRGVGWGYRRCPNVGGICIGAMRLQIVAIHEPTAGIILSSSAVMTM